MQSFYTRAIRVRAVSALSVFRELSVSGSRSPPELSTYASSKSCPASESSSRRRRVRTRSSFRQTWGAIVIKCNELPRFFPANDGGFLSRVFVLPFSTIFYPDDASYKRRIDEGVSPARLKPAEDKTAILDDLLTERPAIIASLARTWIEVRARGGKPYESPECAKAKEAYRTANDTAELFFSAYFIRDEYGAVDYGTVKDSWAEFSGEAKPSMRDIVAMLTKRYPFITPAKSNGVRRLKGISIQTGNEPEEDKERDARDQLPDFQVREKENQEKDIRNEKSGSRSLASLEAELFQTEPEKPAPQSPESSPSLAEKVSAQERSEDEDLVLQGKDLEELGKFRSPVQREYVLERIQRGPPYSGEEREALRAIYEAAQ